ncbi:MAG: pro-sigmaK processing inhibitor BofA family protein [Bacilli bacterium]|nr:pro-sigmaK processing inhibitor BofA family protein [Bacilli bacterium]
MIKRIIKYIKKLIMSFFMLYGYNLIVPARAIIPINIITVLLLTIFSVPALIILIIIKMLIY